MGSVVGTILSFLGKADAFAAEHTWTLVVFVAELIGVCLMQRVKKSYVISEVDITLFMISLRS